MDFAKLMENSLFSNDAEKKALENDTKKLATAFWINLIGMVGIYIIDAENYPAVKAYFKTDKQLQIDNIGDDNNDTSVLIPLIKKHLGSSLVNNLTRFLVRLKQGQSVDEDMFKKNIVEPIFIKLSAKVKAFPKCIKIVKNYIDGAYHLEECIMHMMYISKVRKFCDEFLLLARKAKYRQYNMKPLRAGLVQTTNTQVQSAPDNSATVAQPDDMKKAAPKPKKPVLSKEEEYLNKYADSKANKWNTSFIRNVFTVFYAFYSGKKRISINLGNSNNGTYLDQVQELIKIDDFDRNIFQKKDITLPKTYRSSHDSFYVALALFITYIYPDYFIKAKENMGIYTLIGYDKNDQMSKMIKRVLYSLKEYDIRTLMMFFASTERLDKYFSDIIPLMMSIHLDTLSGRLRQYLGSLKQTQLDIVAAIFRSKATPELIKHLKAAGIWHYFSNEVDLNIIVNFDSWSLEQLFRDIDPDVITNLRDGAKIPKYVKEDEFKEILIRNIIRLDDYSLERALSIYYSVYERMINGIIKFFEYFDHDDRLYKRLLKLLKSMKEGKYVVLLMFVPAFKNLFSEKERLDAWIKGKEQLKGLRTEKYNTESLIKYDTLLTWATVNATTTEFARHMINNKDFFGENYHSRLLKDFKHALVYQLEKIDPQNYGDRAFKNQLTIALLPILTKKDLKKIEINSTIINSFMLNTSIKLNDEIRDHILSNEQLMITPGLADAHNAQQSLNDENKKIIYKTAIKKYPSELLKYNEHGIEQARMIFDDDDEFSKLCDETKISEMPDFPREVKKANAQRVFNAMHAIRLKTTTKKKVEAFVELIAHCRKTGTFSIKRSGVAPQVIDMVFDLYQEDENTLEKLLTSLDPGSKNIIFNEVKRYSTVGPILKSVVKAPIAPVKKMSSNDIKNALKYNNFSLDQTIDIKKKRGEPDHVYLKRYLTELDKMNLDKLLPEQPVNKVEITDEDLAEKTYEWNKKYHAGKHGEIGAQFLEEYNVALKMGDWESFRKEWQHKGDGILNPAFHGTNGTAASMILRFGFAVLSAKELESAGGKYAGSMLGAGIYSAPNLDKISNYIGDSNYGKLGSIGYVFVMDETLGQKNKHYRSAGTGNDGIRSPEYCAKYPREQIKILKCFKAAKSSLKYISNNARKHGVKLNEEFERQIWGDQTLLEDIDEFEVEEKEVGYDTYIFMDGYIPYEDSDEGVAYFDELTYDSNIELSQTQDGITLTIENDTGNFEMFKIPDGFYFSGVKGPVFQKFIKATEGKIKKS